MGEFWCFLGLVSGWLIRFGLLRGLGALLFACTACGAYNKVYYGFGLLVMVVGSWIPGLGLYLVLGQVLQVVFWVDLLG